MVGVCEGQCMRHSLGDEPLTLMRCHSYMKPLKGGSPFVAGHKGEILFFFFFLSFASFTVALFLA